MAVPVDCLNFKRGTPLFLARLNDRSVLERAKLKESEICESVFDGGIVQNTTLVNVVGGVTDSFHPGVGVDTLAVGEFAAAAGDRAVSLGVSASALGDESVVLGHASSSSGVGGAVVGEGSVNSAIDGITIGRSNNIQLGADRTIALGQSLVTAAPDSVIIGQDVSTGPRGVSIGHYARTSTDATENVFINAVFDAAIPTINTGATRNIVIGSLTLALVNATCTRNVLLGIGTTVADQTPDNIAIGTLTSTEAGNAVAVGTQSSVHGAAGVAIGRLAYSDGTSGVAIGENALTSAFAANVAVGASSQCANESCVAVGGNAQADNAFTTAIGASATVSDVDGTAVGALSTSAADRGTALGKSSYAQGVATSIGAYVGDTTNFALTFGVGEGPGLTFSNTVQNSFRVGIRDSGVTEEYIAGTVNSTHCRTLLLRQPVVTLLGGAVSAAEFVSPYWRARTPATVLNLPTFAAIQTLFGGHFADNDSDELVIDVDGLGVALSIPAVTTDYEWIDHNGVVTTLIVLADNFTHRFRRVYGTDRTRLYLISATAN